MYRQSCDIIYHIGMREMREGIKTSLLSILCVAATSVAFAAPTVRMVGGNGTYESAAAATAASRAGSLRATGGYIRPTATTGGATLSAATTTAATTGTATTAGGTATNRVASSPRLSIGKYIGAPKSISSSAGTGSDLTARVKQLEDDYNRLDGVVDGKQDALQDSTYITVQGDEIILNLDKVREDLNIEPGSGREIEFSDNETGLYWNYVDDATDHEVITWAELRERLGTGDVDEKISDAIDDIKEEIAAKYVPLDQTAANAGKVLVVGDDGIVTPTEIDIPSADHFYTKDDVDGIVDDLSDDVDDKLKLKLDKNVGDAGQEGDVMVVDAEGNIVPQTIEIPTVDNFYTKDDVDDIVDELGGEVDDLSGELAKKLDKNVGDTGQEGDVMVVDAEGNIVPQTIEIPTADNYYTKDDVDDIVDGLADEIADEYVPLDQTTANAGKVLVVGDDGIVAPSDTEYATTSDVNNAIGDLGDLAFQDKVGAGQLDDGVVTTETLAAKAVERAKLADDITATLSGAEFWETWWNDHKEELASGNYVVSVGPNTNADNPPQLFRVVTADED